MSVLDGVRGPTTRRLAQTPHFAVGSDGAHPADGTSALVLQLLLYAGRVEYVPTWQAGPLPVIRVAGHIVADRAPHACHSRTDHTSYIPRQASATAGTESAAWWDCLACRMGVGFQAGALQALLGMRASPLAAPLLYCSASSRSLHKLYESTGCVWWPRRDEAWFAALLRISLHTQLHRVRQGLLRKQPRQASAVTRSCYCHN